jgi:hypothetical protein
MLLMVGVKKFKYSDVDIGLSVGLPENHDNTAKTKTVLLSFGRLPYFCQLPRNITVFFSVFHVFTVFFTNKTALDICKLRW